MTSTRHSTLSRPRDDELVEEMRIEHWCLHCDRYWKFAEMEREPDDLPGYCELDAKEDCNERVEQAIARTLKAVVDGMPLPGERSREEYKFPYRGVLIDVALSPTGTGEEE